MGKRSSATPSPDPRLKMLLDDPAAYIEKARERARATARQSVRAQVRNAGRSGRVTRHA